MPQLPMNGSNSKQTKPGIESYSRQLCPRCKVYSPNIAAIYGIYLSIHGTVIGILQLAGEVGKKEARTQ